MKHVAALAALLPLLTACVSPTEGKDAWWQETVLAVPARLGGCAVGDFDPKYPGNEIAVVASDGKVHCVRHGPSGWIHELVAELPGEQIQCAIGDLDPTLPGAELVTVGVARGGEEDGGPGTAILFARQDGAWRARRLLEDSALLHAATIGDLDPARPGNELLVAGFSGDVHLVSLATGEPQARVVGNLAAHAKGAAMGLGGAVLACDDGSLVGLRPAAGTLETTTLAHYPDALARVTATEAAVLVSANDGLLRLRGADGETTNLLQSSDRLRGAVIADVDPTHPGPEMATAGYDGTVSLLWVETAEQADPTRKVAAGDPYVVVRRVGSDDDRLHHLAAGELPGLGTCLVACGTSGRLIVIGRQPVH